MKTLESPLYYKEVIPVYLKGISPEYLLGGLMLELKLQYFGHLMQRTNSLEMNLVLERLRTEREGDNRG